MKKKLKCIGGSLLITLSFVFGVGVISSVAMILMKGNTEHVALISGTAQLLYLLFVILILKIKQVDIQNTYGLKLVPFKDYLLPVAAAFCFSALSNILQNAVPILKELTGGMSDDMEKSAAAFVFSIFVAAPLVEESVFRALIMTKLRKEIPAAASIMISAFLFAFIHSMAGGVILVVHAFFGGVIFALVYEKTRSLFPAIAAHIFGNIGGYVPSVTNSLPAVLQYVTAVGFLVAAIFFCRAIYLKTE